MNKRTLFIFVFGLMVLFQWSVPARMILENGDVVKNGETFRFRTQPIDPNDPFRGRYITLYFDNTTFEVADGENWVNYEHVYVTFTKDATGYAVIEDVSKTRPKHDSYLDTHVDFVSGSQLRIDFPFDRFYIEESKAPQAEISYNEANSDEKIASYALVAIKNGKAVLKDVMLDDVSIGQYIKDSRDD